MMVIMIMRILVINTNLHIFLAPFPSYCRLSNLRFRQRVPIFNIFVWGWT